MTATPHIQEVFEQFQGDAPFARGELYGNGHINDTYLVETTQSRPRYILQRINHLIFPKPWELMENIVRVTGHLRAKIIEQNGDPDREVLTVIPTRNGNSYYRDPDGNYWRLYLFVENALGYQICDNPALFAASGVSFGRFQRQLADFDATLLHEPIADFHNTKVRFDRLLAAISADPLGRAREVQREIEFCLSRQDQMGLLVDLCQRGELPLRVTHNDTKLNNVLIDVTSGQGVCVIDLDTVMPGLALYDFGDSIRFGAATAAEDETDLEKVHMDIGLFEAFTRGFLSEVGSTLTPLERELLPQGARIMTLELVMRFLTDHLLGDTYFKIHRPNHNLDRARAQLKLVQSQENQMDAMASIVASIQPTI